MSEIKLDIKEIMKTVPHRYPFLLIDRITELEEGKRAVAIKNVTINEPFFQGHFPNHPIMPGVLIIEAMAQTGVVVAMRMPQTEGKIIYFAGIDKVRFRKPVLPGDQIVIEAEVLWVRGALGKMKAAAKVEEEIAAEGEFMFSLVEEGAGKAKIHPTATVHPSAKLAEKVKIGAYAVIGPEVEIGEGTSIGAHTIITKWVKIGKNNRIYQNVVIGAPPQDYKYKSERGEIIIGDRNIIREFVTIHLPTSEGGKTWIGDENFIMVHAHIPHNCKVGNQIVIGGYVGIGGHAEIADQVTVGGLAGIHQFVRIGRLSMVGAQSKIIQDIPPFMLVDGNPAQVRSINSIGLQRRGISAPAQTEIKKAFKIIYGSKTSHIAALSEIKKRCRDLPEIAEIVKFLEEETDRGISKKADEIPPEDLILPDIPEIGI